MLLHDDKKLEEFKNTLKKYNLTIAGLSTHGNAVHPVPEIAKKFHDDFVNAVLLAEKLGVETGSYLLGLPRRLAGRPHPQLGRPVRGPRITSRCWTYQWNEGADSVLEGAGRQFAKAHGIKKIAFEMHPGFCVYNPETLLKLRNAGGRYNRR